jgi:hypothetical protein
MDDNIIVFATTMKVFATSIVYYKVKTSFVGALGSTSWHGLGTKNAQIIFLGLLLKIFSQLYFFFSFLSIACTNIWL